MPFDCPSCGKRLEVASARFDDHADVIVWCTYGPCKSHIANFGVIGKTDQESYDKLVIAMEKEEKERANE